MGQLLTHPPAEGFSCTSRAFPAALMGRWTLSKMLTILKLVCSSNLDFFCSDICHPEPMPTLICTGAVVNAHRCRRHPAPVALSPCTVAVVIPHRYLRHLAPAPSSPRTSAVVTPHWCRHHPAPVPSSPHTGAISSEFTGNIKY